LDEDIALLFAVVFKLPLPHEDIKVTRAASDKNEDNFIEDFLLGWQDTK
jgi:hypothetical protein